MRVKILERAWRRWVPIARAIADFQVRLLLVVFYAIVFPPFALVVRLVSDPLGLKPGGAGWHPVRPSGGPYSQF